jgi:hypothetical protein
MTQLNANVSPLLPHQFPGVYREQEPQFVMFVKAYFAWLEQSNNINYFTRRIYDIKDVDNTFDSFIVYFKEKYLKNIHFDTKSDIRMFIKHALDLYRSKGTERATQLLFRAVLNEPASFYYPSTDLFKLSDGIWSRPIYLELTMGWNNNIKLEHKEIIGVQSQAIAFVDAIIRRKTNGRLQDIAYISAITGNFKSGEKIQPTDGSLAIGLCPTITGSLTNIQFPIVGSGQNYNPGDVIPISSLYGQSGLMRVTNVANSAGLVSITFIDGGYGFQTNASVYVSNAVIQYSNLQMFSSNLEQIHYFNWQEVITQPLATINYISGNGTFTAGMNVFTWSAGIITGSGVVLAANSSNSTAGQVVVNILSGNMNNTFFTTANTIKANVAVAGYVNSTATGTFIANNNYLTLRINNEVGTFYVGEEVSQPIVPGVDMNFGGGVGVVSGINPNFIQLVNVEGVFFQNQPATGTTMGQIFGQTSGATANVTGVDIGVGLINIGTKPFVASPFSYAFSAQTNGYIGSFTSAGAGFSVTVANTLLYPETVSINTDKLSDYAGLPLNNFNYGFPANANANANNGTISSTMSFTSLTVGKLAKIVLSGVGNNFITTPFVVIDQSNVSAEEINDDILQITGTSVHFSVGEIINQAATGARGMVKSFSNSSVMNVQRMKYANDFILTTNSTTTIIGASSNSTANVVNVDPDIMSPIMGRNVNLSTAFATGANTIITGQIVDSGFGFVNGDAISVGSNGAIGTAVIQTQGEGTGFYLQKGGFLSDQKKLFDGYFWQNFSYQIVSSVMLPKYQQMLDQITHPSGTIRFGSFVHNSQSNGQINVTNAVVNVVPFSLPGYAWWKFNANSGTTLIDSAQLDSGTFQGTLGSQWVSGKFTSGLLFNGIDNYVSSSNNIVNPQLFSISTWFKTNTVAGGKIVGFADVAVGSEGQYDRHIYMDTSGKIFAGVFDTGEGNVISSSLSYNDNNFHNAIFTFTGSLVSLYIDGNLVNSHATGAAQSYTGGWKVGGTKAWVGGYFQGIIDDVRIYNTVISSAEITYLQTNE